MKVPAQNQKVLPEGGYTSLVSRRISLAHQK